MKSERDAFEKCREEAYQEYMSGPYPASEAFEQGFDKGWQARAGLSPQWISVNERLPNESDMYLVCCVPTAENDVSKDRVDIFSAVWETEVPDGRSPYWLEVSYAWHVTHWQPLPAPPMPALKGTGNG